HQPLHRRIRGAPEPASRAARRGDSRGQLARRDAAPPGWYASQDRIRRDQLSSRGVSSAVGRARARVRGVSRPRGVRVLGARRERAAAPRPPGPPCPLRVQLLPLPPPPPGRPLRCPAHPAPRSPPTAIGEERSQVLSRRGGRGARYLLPRPALR